MFNYNSSSVVLLTLGSAFALAACGSETGAAEDRAALSASAGAKSGVEVDVKATLNICGRVDAYVAASTDAAGSLTMDGKPLTLAAGARVRGAALLVVQASVCIRATLDVRGSVTDCEVVDASASAGAGAGAGGTSSGGAGDDCDHNGSSGGSSSGGSSSGGTSGTSSGGTSSGGTSSGGSSSGGSSSGGSSSGGSSSGGGGAGGGGAGGGGAGGGGAGGGGGVAVDLSADLDLCGKLQAFTSAASGAGAGLCTVGGNTLPIMSGTALTGEALAAVGANVCLHATIDASGRVSAPSSITLDVLGAAKVHVCGKVRAYAAASASANGSVAVGGPGFQIAAGTQLSGAAMLTLGASVCIDASLDVNGRIKTGACTAN